MTFTLRSIYTIKPYAKSMKIIFITYTVMFLYDDCSFVNLTIISNNTITDCSLGMDINAFMGSLMGMPGMNMGVNPFVQFLNQSGIGGPNWSGLSGIYSHLISRFWTLCLLYSNSRFS